MTKARASLEPIRVSERSGLTIVVVDEWPATPNGVYFVDSGHSGRFKPDFSEFRKRARGAARERLGHGGAEKGRLLTLYRSDPGRSAVQTVAALHWHVESKHPFLILRVDMAGWVDSTWNSILYRQHLVDCVEEIMARLSWTPGRLEWKTYSDAEAKVIQQLPGFRRYKLRSLIGRAHGGEIWLYRDRRDA